MKRSKGEGTVYQRADGLWIAQITLPNGKRQSKYGKTQKEVRDWLLTRRKELSEGILADDGKLTLGVFLDKWFEDIAKPKLRPSTLTVHECMIRLHIKPEIGHVRLSQLTPIHLQNLYTQKLKEGLSKRSVKYIHTILNQALGQALRWGLVSRNVAGAVDAPIPEYKKIHPLPPRQVKELLAVLRGDRLYGYYVVLLGCGLRRGEGLALTWDCVDLDNGVIYVKKTLQAQKGKGLVLGEPKTESSIRVIGMPDFVKDALLNQPRFPNSPFVFYTSNGTPFGPRNIVRHFKKALKKAGLPETTKLHDCRHFFVSYLLSQNVPPKDVQVIVGHADFKTTLSIYGHVMPGYHQDAAKKMDGLLRS